MTTLAKRNRKRNGPDSLIDLIFNGDDFFGLENLPNDAISTPQYDIIEKDNNYIIEFMLPGFKKENISIDIEDNTLLIEGERKVNENNKYNYKGSFYGKFKRSFELPENIEVNSIDASFEDGILSVYIPKKDESKVGKKSISIQ